VYFGFFVSFFCKINQLQTCFYARFDVKRKQSLDLPKTKQYAVQNGVFAIAIVVLQSG